MPQTSLQLHYGLVRRLSRLYRKIFLERRSDVSKKSSANTLLKYAGTWTGNDLEDCLHEVLRSRGEAQF